jgi:chitinase
VARSFARRPLRPARFLAAALVTALSALGLTLTQAGSASAATNLLVNPGFESGSTAGWTCTGGTSAQTATHHSGSYALTGAPAGQDFAQCSQRVTVQPNSTYTLTAWVQGPFVYLGATGTGGTDPSTWSNLTTWNQLSTTFTTGPSTTSTTVYLHGWYAQGAYFADDVVLAGPGSDPGQPTVPAAPTGLAAGATTSSSVPLTWNSVSNATAYNVYRNGTKVDTVTTNSATEAGLAASTTYSFQVTATNAAGESPKSNTVSATTQASGGGGGGGTVPKHALTGYWQNFDNGAAKQRLRDVQSQYDIIAVSFADATGTPGGISFALDPTLSSELGYSKADFIADIQAKHAAGKKVVLSVGGQNGTISVNDSTSATNFANSAYSAIQQYGFDGVDIDLENGINATYMSQALHSLASKVGSGFVLTMAPQTIDMQSTSAGYFQLALNTRDILTVVNTQYYNSGSMLGCDGRVYSQGSVDFLTALACIQLQGGLSPSQVGLGVPASTSAAGSGYISPTVVDNALDCLTKGTNCGSFRPSTTWPGLRGAMTWSTNWDQSNGNSFSNSVGPHVHGLP